MEVLSEDEAACRNVIAVVATGWHPRCLQVWVNEGSVTCFPLSKPPLFSGVFALAAFIFATHNVRCLRSSSDPIGPASVGFFMATCQPISCCIPEKRRNRRVVRCLLVASKHRASTGRNVAVCMRRSQDRQRLP